MSWRDICPMDEKIKFIASIKEGSLSFSTICKFYGISRKTGYKWLSRYEEEGVQTGHIGNTISLLPMVQLPQFIHLRRGVGAPENLI